MGKISIITPTENREAFLPAIWDCVKSQSIQDFEWLIHDGSPQPSVALSAITDPRVRYIHSTQPMSLGAKRNVLVGSAVGDTIIHMDDDDYYAPEYIEAMLTLLVQSNADIVKLYGFYLYHQASQRFAYWDLEHTFPFHYLLHPRRPDTPVGLRMVGAKEAWGYGFSYVYHRRVWDKRKFPDQGHGEDQVFADAAIAEFRHAGMQDRQQLAVHVIHTSNTSVSFPQQLLPADFHQTYFQGFVVP
ncbi:glycosyltransferase family 2 protein [Hyphomicrobium sp. DY-1]|uniref:glycosyltransferase family 2 protein n=1 Tax=Hyphomicrobium sp. DY-1 TaxID=3075650 RepID=UPI0039C28CB2